jgi:anaerobic selenocysteine-containing dehydrogenase
MSMKPGTPPLVAIEADRIRQLARDFANAESAVAYGRVGANCQSFGTLAIWMIDCLNILTGNLDREGGVLFPTGILPQLLDMPYVGEQPPHGRWRSRTSSIPELGGTMPTLALWEEIETPGPGQLRGLVVAAGNPVLSNPNAARVTAALEQVEFMVAVDIYLNETSRHADIILPPMDHLKRSEFTMIYGNWMVESIGCYSGPVFQREVDDHDDFDVLTALAARLTEMPEEAFRARYAEGYVAAMVPRLARYPHGLSPADALARASGDNWPERIYDILLRGGPFGDGFGDYENGLSLGRMKQTPSGVNYGPMGAGRFPAGIDTPDGKVQLVPTLFAEDLTRLEAAIEAGAFDAGFLLINRRHIRSNNSWMHNVRNLAKGPTRCTAFVNPGDAARLGIRNGDLVRLRSRVGEIEIASEISDSVGQGVISVPHGWGGVDPLARLSFAQRGTPANVNALSDDAAFDRPSGGAAFNGIAIEIEPLRSANIVLGGTGD